MKTIVLEQPGQFVLILIIVVMKKKMAKTFIQVLMMAILMIFIPILIGITIVFSNNSMASSKKVI